MDALSIFNKLTFANMTWAILLPIILMGLDIVTGLIGAWTLRDFQSSKMRSGLAKKIGEIAMLFIGVLFCHAMNLPDAVIKFISLYLILMELMSIIENLDKLSCPMPAFVKRVINNIGTSVNNDSYSEIKEKLENLEGKIDGDHS